RGETSNALVYLHDVMPTICDLTGIPTPAGVEARSLAPIIRGERRAVRDTLLLAYDTDAEVKRPVGDEGRGIAMTERTTATMTSIPRGSLRALRVGRWKLIRTRFDDHRHTLLFDLDADPDETTNLAANPTPDHAARIERMTTGLHAAMHATGDDLPPADRP
ncbi:MAG: hypothetical protein KJO43_02285, partial [Phycisphaerae bacterium]|nr:hypothetical protein [Phycisphaerae bacterium]